MEWGERGTRNEGRGTRDEKEKEKEEEEEEEDYAASGTPLNTSSP